MNITDLKKYLHSQKEHPQNPTGNVLGLESKDAYRQYDLFFVHFFDTGQEKTVTMPDRLKTPMQVNAFIAASPTFHRTRWMLHRYQTTFQSWHSGHLLHGVVQSQSAWALRNPSWRGRSYQWTIVKVQMTTGNARRVGQVHSEKQKCLTGMTLRLPAHLPASEAAPKWFEDYHDVNICGFDCIMGRSNAGRWSVSGETELFSSKKKKKGEFTF